MSVSGASGSQPQKKIQGTPPQQSLSGLSSPQGPPAQQSPQESSEPKQPAGVQSSKTRVVQADPPPAEQTQTKTTAPGLGKPPSRSRARPSFLPPQHTQSADPTLQQAGTALPVTQASAGFTESLLPSYLRAPVTEAESQTSTPATPGPWRDGYVFPSTTQATEPSTTAKTENKKPESKPPQDPAVLLGRAVQHTVAYEGQAGVAEAKKQVQTAVDEVLKQYYAAQTPQNKEVAIKKLNELETQLQRSQADKKSKDALAAIIGSGVGMIEAYEKKDAAGFVANAANLGKGAWNFGEKLLREKFGDQKFLELSKAVNSGTDAANAVACAFKAYQLFSEGKVKEGAVEALKGTGSAWSLARNLLGPEKIPPSIGDKVGRVLAGGPQVAGALFDLHEAIQKHDAAKGVAAGGGLGQGIMTMLGPDKLKALGLSATQQTMLSVAFSVAQDTPELYAATKYLAVKGINWGDQACNAAIAKIATIAGKQGVYAYTLGKTGSPLLASALSALTAFALNKGYEYMKEMADNQDLVNYIEGRQDNAKAVRKWATNRIGLRTSRDGDDNGVEVDRFANYLLAGDENTKILMRGLLRMSKDTSNPRAAEQAREAFRTLEAEGRLQLNTGNYGYLPAEGQIGNADYTKV
jgi:hypothetical protein